LHCRYVASSATSLTTSANPRMSGSRDSHPTLRLNSRRGAWHGRCLLQEVSHSGWIRQT